MKTPEDIISAASKDKSRQQIGGTSGSNKPSTNSNSNNNPASRSKKSRADEKSFDDILAQNDAQMEKSHKPSQRSDRSPNAGGGQSQAGASDDNINDLSGHNLRMNTSLEDRH